MAASVSAVDSASADVIPAAALTNDVSCTRVPTCVWMQDLIHTQLSVREGLELVVSVGMSLPPTLIASKVSKYMADSLRQQQ